MLTYGLARAEQLALQHTGDGQAYSLLYSG